MQRRTPGANDDGSGVALVLEAARILSHRHFRATIVYAVVAGEEQGLYGSTLLAKTAKARCWLVDAMLNNDIVGNTIGQNGVRVADRVRVFSEGIRASEDLHQQMIAPRAIGGEDDGPEPRARQGDRSCRRHKFPGGLDVFVDRRPDRFGRGGDHEPFLALGYPAVRFTVGAENWTQQHQDSAHRQAASSYGDTDRPDGFSLSRQGRPRSTSRRSHRLASAAPAAPGGRDDLRRALRSIPRSNGGQAPGAVGYRVHWRRTDKQDWTQYESTSRERSTVLKNVPVDDTFVGVSARRAPMAARAWCSFAGADRG